MRIWEVSSCCQGGNVVSHERRIAISIRTILYGMKLIAISCRQSKCSLTVWLVADGLKAKMADTLQQAETPLFPKKHLSDCRTKLYIVLTNLK